MKDISIYLGRQPIFDLAKDIFAYELLFRPGNTSESNVIDGEYASAEVISNTFLEFGFDNVTQKKKGFINFTEKLIFDKKIEKLPNEKIVVEILETVKPSQEVFERCKELKKLNFILALDDFEYSEEWDKFFDIIDIIKVDFMITKGEERKKIFDIVNDKDIIFLAEKIETYEEYEEAKEAGYELFQGYFFSKPVVLSQKKLSSSKLNYLQLIKHLYADQFQVDKIKKIIERDVSLTLKLLKFINSSFFGMRREISSIKQAILLLGEKELKKWITIIAFSNFGSNKPDELFNLTLMRARFAQNIIEAKSSTIPSEEYFLMGMFSLIDAFLDKPMEDILQSLKLSENIKNCLLEKEESLMSNVYKVLTSYEKADWNQVDRIISEEVGITKKTFSKAFHDTLEWVNKIEI